jgi:hypothetical protein
MKQQAGITSEWKKTNPSPFTWYNAPGNAKTKFMKTRIIFIMLITFSMSSWINNHDKTQLKVKESNRKSTPVQSTKKQPGKKSVRPLFESVLFHLI